MLDEIKLSYEQCADTCVPDWRHLNKNALIKKCLEVENIPELYNGYISAIVARYWSVATKYYYQNRSSVSPEDCYEWLLDSIIYALKLRQWEDPKSAIYNDPNGPDKVINRCMSSARLLFYQYSNCMKRKVNYQVSSVEKLHEDFGDTAFPAKEDEELESVNDISRDLVIKAYNKKDYFSCVLIDNIVNKDTYDIIKEEDGVYTIFNPKKLARALRQCDDKYCKEFSHKYNLDVQEMQNDIVNINKFSSEKMYRWINKALDKLRNNKEIQELFE